MAKKEYAFVDKDTMEPNDDSQKIKLSGIVNSGSYSCAICGDRGEPCLTVVTYTENKKEKTALAALIDPRGCYNPKRSSSKTYKDIINRVNS